MASGPLNQMQMEEFVLLQILIFIFKQEFFYGITLDTFPIYISLARYPFLKVFLAELLEKNIALSDTIVRIK